MLKLFAQRRAYIEFISVDFFVLLWYNTLDNIMQKKGLFCMAKIAVLGYGVVGSCRKAGLVIKNETRM